jgi:5-methylcytosine-specific restriction endonuclease McrA
VRPPKGITGAGSTRAWRRLRLAVLERDAWRCQVPVDGAGRIDPAGAPCLLPADTVDHLTPRALGGLDVEDNLRAACRTHNRAKSDRLDVDAAAAARTPAPAGRQRPPGARPRPWHW